MLVGKIHHLLQGINDKSIPVSSIDKIGEVLGEGEVLRKVEGLACRKMYIDVETMKLFIGVKEQEIGACIL